MSFRDPSFGLSIASLVSQSPATIPSAFQSINLFLDALSIGDSFARLSLQVDLSQAKLASWVIASGWSSGLLDPDLRFHEHEIHKTITTISQLYCKLEKVAKTYNVALQPAENDRTERDDGQHSTIRQEIVRQQELSMSISQKNPATNYRRYLFAATDGPQLAKLTSELAAAVDSLISRLPERLKFIHLDLFREDELQRVRSVRKNNVSALCELRDNLQAINDQSMAATIGQVAQTRRAEDLELRQLQAIQGRHEETPFQCILEKGSIKRVGTEAEGHPRSGRTIGIGTRNNSHGYVLVESRKFSRDALDADTDNDKAFLLRAALDSLCLQLSSPESEKPNDLRILQCLGHMMSANYFAAKAGENDDYYHLVFAWPKGCSTSDPITLYSLLQGDSSDRNPFRPSLEVRLELALVLVRALLRFHEIGWMHKGIRSTNVIFFPESGAGLVSPPNLTLSQRPGGSLGQSIRRPYLSGFEHSRRWEQTQHTNKESENNTLNDLYRHPSCQGGVTQGGDYQLKYDIYSLGIILCEIGQWARVDSIRFRKKKQVLTPLQLRDLLLRPEDSPTGYQSPANDLAYCMGTTYKDAVLRCLRGNFDENVDDSIRAFQRDVVALMERARKML